jgi:hypothetical protein
MAAKVKWIPSTPGGSVLIHLAAGTEEQAWKNLLRDADHMPYKTMEAFKQRGYVVEKWTEKKNCR